jgi:hypothetical protein
VQAVTIMIGPAPAQRETAGERNCCPTGHSGSDRKHCARGNDLRTYFIRGKIPPNRLQKGGKRYRYPCRIGPPTTILVFSGSNRRAATTFRGALEASAHRAVHSARIPGCRVHERSRAWISRKTRQAHASKPSMPHHDAGATLVSVVAACQQGITSANACPVSGPLANPREVGLH